jgi:hypothetical protein
LRVVKGLDLRGIGQAGHLYEMRQMRQYNRGVSRRTNYLLNIAFLVVLDAEKTKKPSSAPIRNFTDDEK